PRVSGGPRGAPGRPARARLGGGDGPEDGLVSVACGQLVVEDSLHAADGEIAARDAGLFLGLAYRRLRSILAAIDAAAGEVPAVAIVEAVAHQYDLAVVDDDRAHADGDQPQPRHQRAARGEPGALGG